MQSFEQQLTGGHPNSLGNTLVVVEDILAHPQKLEELYQCYFSLDEIVRLRVSSVMKRICKLHPEWVVPYIDRLLDQVAGINQASTQWTLATLFDLLRSRMSAEQFQSATHHLKQNLAKHQDWIVLNTTMETLFKWSKNDEKLNDWLKPHLKRLSQDSRKSVSKRAKKYLLGAKS